MAKNDVLSCLEKRDLLNQPAASAKSLQEWGETMERQGLLHDALTFYEKAGVRDAIARIREIAEKEGDLFLFRCSIRALREDPTPEIWVAVGKRAAELGKTAFAKEAFRHAGREDLIPEAQSSPSNPS
ncbi:MAG: hypothetical protein AB9873_14035 [Syntrophobacteraceae bacterium]